MSMLERIADNEINAIIVSIQSQLSFKYGAESTKTITIIRYLTSELKETKALTGKQGTEARRIIAGYYTTKYVVMGV